MANDFFLGFAGHAHTRNELETDQQREVELRRHNSPKEAQKLVGMVLDKLEKDISESGYSLEDVKLLILYLSYRGEPAERDTRICGSILRAIENRFRKHASSRLRFVGHTTCGELENEDLILKEISGVGYNGLSLMALVTDLPIGVGRTWGLRTAEEAGEQGREMTRDAWIDLGQQTTSKEHLHTGKTLLVLTEGSKVDTAGYEHFLAEGIARFMKGTREARIMNVIGGSSGDGLTARLCHQFYGESRGHPQLKILDGEAVCALIPSSSEVSIGVAPGTEGSIFGKQHTFHFDTEKEPHYKYVRRIDNEDACAMVANMIYELEGQLPQEKGLPLPDRKVVSEMTSKALAEQRLLIFNPALWRYTFSFPFGNYAACPGIRVVGEDIELMFPIRNYTPEMLGYLATGGDYKGVGKEARRLYDMLRADQGFSRNDATVLVSCINRRIGELVAGIRSGTEAEILKEGLSSTQAIGFLAVGELAFTNLVQEPFFHAFTCWGITLHSRTAQAQGVVTGDQAIGISRSVPGRVTTGHLTLDRLLCGGIPENYAVALTAPSCEERDSLVMGFLKKGAEQAETTFFLTVDPIKAKSLAESQGRFHLVVCNPQADAIIKDQPGTVKLKGVENLTDISIALSSAISRLDPSLGGPRRICIELLSDVLLQHHAVQTRRWLTSLITELKSSRFTALAVIDPRIHPSEELYAILGLFDGEVSLHEKQTEKGPGKYLKINKMSNQEYLESEMPLRKEDLQKRK